MPDLTKISDSHLLQLCMRDPKAVQICNDDRFWRERYHTQFPDYSHFHDGRLSWRQYYNDTVNLLSQKVTPALANMYLSRPDLLKILASLGIFPSQGAAPAPSGRGVVDCHCGSGSVCYLPGHTGQKPVVDGQCGMPVDNKWHNPVDGQWHQKPVVDQGGLLLGGLLGGVVGYELGKENQRRYDYRY